MSDYLHEYIAEKQRADENEQAYNALGKETNRLRSVAREYDWFYSQVSDAFKEKDWAKVENAMKDCK